MPYHKTLDTPLNRLNNNRLPNPPTGDVGIEIEVEGWNLPTVDNMVAAPRWRLVQDGSLRAPANMVDKKDANRVMLGGAAEFVLKSPIKIDDFDQALTEIHNVIGTAQSQLIWSNRTSVHVHINASSLTARELFGWFTLYYIVEDLITEIAGRDRMGNLFCLRGLDAEEVVFRLAESVSMGVDQGTGAVNFDGLARERNMRYSAMNLAAMFKYESVEFRAHHGTLDQVALKRWVNLLYHLREEGRKFRRPSDIIAQFSTLGPMEFVNKYLPRDVADMINVMSRRDERLWEGVRLVQPLAFASDWPESPAQQSKKALTAADVLVEDFLPDEWVPVIEEAEPLDDAGDFDEGLDLD